MRIKTLVTLVCTALALQATSGLADDLVQKSVDIENVRRVSVNGSVELIITPGVEETLVIAAPKTMVKWVGVKQRGRISAEKMTLEIAGSDDFKAVTKSDYQNTHWIVL